MATVKQKKALDNMVENGGNVSKAMRDAGYSPETAKSPSKLTKSKAYEELLDEYLPEDKLLGYLSEDLGLKGQNRKAELELAFKLRGKLTDRIDHTTKGKELPMPILGGITKQNAEDEGTDSKVQ